MRASFLERDALARASQASPLTWHAIQQHLQKVTCRGLYPRRDALTRLFTADLRAPSWTAATPGLRRLVDAVADRFRATPFGVAPHIEDLLADASLLR